MPHAGRECRKARLTPDQLQGLVDELKRRGSPTPLVEALDAIAHIGFTLPATQKIRAYSEIMAAALRQPEPVLRHVRVNPGIPPPVRGAGKMARPEQEAVMELEVSRTSYD